MTQISDEYRDLDELRPHPRNYNQHEWGVPELAAAMRLVAYTAPMIIKPDGTILAGHGRRLALQKLRAEGYAEPIGVQDGWRVPCRVVECNEIDELRILATDNPDPKRVQYDTQALASILADLQSQESLEGTWYDADRLAELLASEGVGEGGEGSESEGGEARKTLAERFGVPPFSVLDARQGYWQDRKRAWLALGIQSELGRGGPAGKPVPGTGRKRKANARTFGQDLMRKEHVVGESGVEKL